MCSKRNVWVADCVISMKKIKKCSKIESACRRGHGLYLRRGSGTNDFTT